MLRARPTWVGLRYGSTCGKLIFVDDKYHFIFDVFRIVSLIREDLSQQGNAKRALVFLNRICLRILYSHACILPI